MAASVVGASVAFSGTAAAATTTVTGGGDNLQVAIDNANPDDVLVVADSEQYNAIEINNPNRLTIRAADDANPTISGSPRADGAVVDIDANKVTFEGFRVESTVSGDDELVDITGTLPVIQNNTFIGEVPESALEVDSDTVTITGNDFSQFETEDAANPEGDIDLESVDTVNGKDEVNNQIISLVQENTGVKDVEVSNNQVTTNSPREYGLVLSKRQVTTGDGDSPKVPVKVDVYGAEEDGKLEYELFAPGGSTVESDTDIQDQNGDGVYEFTVDAQFAEEGDYTLLVRDQDRNQISGQRDIRSKYEVINLDPQEVTVGTQIDVTGKMVNREGEPVVNERITIDSPSTNNVASDRTDAEGKFLLDNVTFNTAGVYPVNAPDSTGNVELRYEEVIAKNRQYRVEPDPSSVEFDVETTVDFAVFDENDNRVTGSPGDPGPDLTELVDDPNDTGPATQAGGAVSGGAQGRDPNANDLVDTTNNGRVDTIRLEIEADQSRTAPVVFRVVHNERQAVGTAELPVFGGDVDSSRTLEISGNGEFTFYSFAVEDGGDVEITDGDREDRVSQETAFGAVGSGKDVYEITGDLANFYLEGDAQVTLDGSPVDTESKESTVTIAGDGSFTSYSFEVMNGSITGSSGLSQEDNIDQSDESASGAVGGGNDMYTFTGTFRGLDKDGSATVRVNGQPVDPELFYNSITFQGDGSYDFEVSGEIKQSEGLTQEDSAGVSSASGAVGDGGTDGPYVYSGTLQDLNADSGVNITRNGEAVSDNYEDN